MDWHRFQILQYLDLLYIYIIIKNIREGLSYSEQLDGHPNTYEFLDPATGKNGETSALPHCY